MKTPVPKTAGLNPRPFWQNDAPNICVGNSHNVLYDPFYPVWKFDRQCRNLCSKYMKKPLDSPLKGR